MGNWMSFSPCLFRNLRIPLAGGRVAVWTPDGLAVKPAAAS